MKYVKYLLIAIVIVTLGYLGYSIYKTPSIVGVKVEKPVSVAEEWPIYKSSKYGLELSYPTGFVVEEDGGTFDVHFGSTLINHGNIYIRVSDKTNLDSISYVNKGASNMTTLSSRDGTNNNGIIFREIKRVQDSSTNMANILFLNGSNAYDLNWSCWSSKPCFNDETLEKIIQSIKFNN